MSSEILVSTYNSDKTLHAVLEKHSHNVWLYLCSLKNGETSSSKIIGDVFVCNTVPLIEHGELDSYKPNLPPITKSFGLPEAVCKNIENVIWEISWITKESILLLKDNKPWALITSGENRGMSKSIRKSGPWGNSWHEQKYKKIKLTN